MYIQSSPFQKKSKVKGGGTKKHGKIKSDDYKVKGTDYMSEEINRIKSLMV